MSALGGGDYNSYGMSVSIALSNKMFPRRHPNIARKFFPVDNGKQVNRLNSISTHAKGMMELRSPFTPPQIIPNIHNNKTDSESPQRVSYTNEVGVGPDINT